MPEGEHAYKFVVDGSNWLHDAANPWTTDDDFGGFNSVAAVRCDASELVADPSRPSDGVPAATRPHGWSFDNHVASGVVSSSHLEAYLGAAAGLAERQASSVPEAACGSMDASCVASFVEGFGERAFRRPLTPGESDRYQALLTGAGTFDDGVTLVVEAMLVSPSFLYRSEVGSSKGDIAVLDAYERASALSYFLWGTTPDATLLTAAAAGELDTVSGIETHARRMLGDARARETAEAFAAQWLGIERVLTADKRTDLFPDWTVTARTSAVKASQALYSHTVFDGEGTFDALLSSPVHFVDPALARVYGVSAGGDGLTQMPLTDPPRPGVLGEASVLAATSHSDQTSPVRRGLFVRERLLCQDLGTPPPEAGGVPTVDSSASTRERFEQHMEERACSICHKYIDPVGFAFEGFDPVGSVRDMDAGKPIDTTGEMTDIERNGGDSVPFHSLDELAAMLVDSEAAPRCFTRELYRFAMGFEEAEDDCTVETLAARFDANGRDVQQLMLDIVTSPTFTQRRPEVP
jgi:hypothetical protein